MLPGDRASGMRVRRKPNAERGPRDLGVAVPLGAICPGHETGADA